MGHLTGEADDHVLASELAAAAGQLLLRLRSQSQLEPAVLRAEGDRRSHDYLMAELAALRPGDAVLSEEGADDHRRLDAERVWIVDPLDGTREFGEVPRDDWAVHVAQWERGELVAGAVARPARDSTLGTGGSPGSAPRPSGPLRLAVSRSRPPRFVSLLAEVLGAQLVPMGSAGIKACSVVDGTTDAYVHAGGQYEWDSAAPVAVARANGLHCSRVDGSRLAYNQPDPLLPDLVVCRPELADRILTALADMADYEEAV